MKRWVHLLLESRARALACVLACASTAIGCQENGVTKFNNDPDATLRFPAEGDELALDEPFLATGTVDDDDHSTSDLIARWYVNGELGCESTPELDGDVECELVVDSAEATVRLEVRDPMGSTGEDTVKITAIRNNLPTITMETPFSGMAYYRDKKVQLLGTIWDAEDDPNDLSILVESDVDGAFSVTVHDDGMITGSQFMTEGEHILSIRVEDSHGGVALEEIFVTVGGPNTPPTCSIIAPANGSAVDVVETVVLEGVTNDVNVGSEYLEITWVSSLEGVLGTSEADSAGQTILPVTGMRLATHVVTMQVEDEVGGRCSDFIMLTVGEPPDVIVTSPEEGGVYGYGLPLPIEATVVDGEDSPDSIGLEWSSSLDGVFSEQGADSTGEVEFVIDTLSPGPQSMTVTATDMGGLFSTEVVNFIVNELPSAPTVQITSIADAECAGVDLFTTDDLFACVTEDSVDPDGDPITYSYTWYRDGELVPEMTDSRLSASATLRDEEWRVMVTPADSLSDGFAGHDSTIIRNTAPVISDLIVDPDPSRTDDDLTCALGLSIEPDGDELSYSYTWQVNGSTSAETSAVLPSTFHQKGDAVSCAATPWDGTDWGPETASSIRLISNSAPSVAEVSISPEVVSTGDVLSCSYDGFYDPDGEEEPDLSTFSWQINGEFAGEGWTLDGGFSGGDLITCLVTPSDGEDEGEVVDANTVVSNTSPTISGVEITPSGALSTDTLSCSWTGWYDLDGDADLSRVEWSVNGESVSTGSTLSSMFSGGDLVTCTVTAFDGTASGTELATSITIVNTPPSASAAVISPSPATVLNTLTCEAEVYTDPDSRDEDLSTRLWTVNGVEAGTSPTLAGSFAGGDVVQCTLTPFDGHDTGPSVTTSVTIENTIPVIPWVLAGPDPATAATPLTCVWGEMVDPDGHPETVSIEWTINGELASIEAELVGGFGAGDDVVCTVTPYDGYDYGAPVSDSVTIENTLPTIGDVTITPDPAVASDELLCSWDGYYDADGDADASMASWAINGLFAGIGPVLTGGYVYEDVVSCTVIPSDGWDSGDAVVATVSIDNTPPIVEGVNITPVDATVDSTLTCDYDLFYDVDGGSDESTMVWFVDGVEVGTGPTLSSGFVGGQMVHCLVTPSDGTDSGDTVSGELEIQNTAPSVSAVLLTPVAPKTGDTVTCDWLGYDDADGHADISLVTWTVNGVEVSTDRTITGGFLSGDELGCTVTPYDGLGEGEPVSRVVEVVNAPPTIMSVTVVPYTPVAADTLTCSWSGYSDPEGDADMSLPVWNVNGVPVGSGTELIGGFVHEDIVECVVTPSDGESSGIPVSGSVSVDNTAPTVVSASIIPEPLYRNNDLTCVWEGYEDADGETDASTVVWRVEGSPVATGPVLSGGTADELDDISCSVTAFDGTDTGNTVTGYGSISPSIPSITGVTITPSPAYKNSTLTCTWEGYYDADGDPDSTWVRWYHEGETVGTDFELESTFVPGDEVRCRVVPFDGMHEGAEWNQWVTIENAPPVVEEVTLSPDPAYEGDVLTCTPGATTDLDGGTFFVHRYRWWIDDEEMEWPSSSLSSAYFDKGQEVRCAVNADDGLDEGDYTDSNTVYISNSLPVVDLIELTPDGADTTDTLVATVTTSDADGDEVIVSYDWYVNDILVSTSPVLNGEIYFDKGDRVYVEVVLFDGEDAGDPTTSETIEIQNTPPSAPTVTASPIDPVTGQDDLLCVVDSGSSDIDGDSFSYEVTWKRDEFEVMGDMTTTLTGDGVYRTNIKAYEVWTCLVRANDGDDLGEAGTDSVTVQAIFEGWETVDTSLADADRFIIGEDSKDYSGRTVAWAGDVDADGRSDILVAAPDNDDAYTSAGKVYLVRAADMGSETTIPLNDVGIAWTGTAEGNNLGGYVQSRAIASAGDVDGDGLDDFLIGEPLYEDPDTSRPNGRAYLMLGGSVSVYGSPFIPSVDTEAGIIFEGPNYGQLGHSVESAGDVDGDGIPDVLMGAPNASGGRGVTYLFWGEDLAVAGDTLWVEDDASVQFTAESPGDEVGLRATTAGDVDGDGLADLLVGAPSNDVGGESRAGRSYLFLAGSIDDTSHALGSEADHLFNGQNANDLSGHALSALGDVDKDGYDDFVIGAKGVDTFGSNSGAAFVISGGDLGIFRGHNLDESWVTLGGEAAGDRVGHDVEGAGDVDSDGRGDILVAAYAHDSGGSAAGRTYLVLGISIPDEGGSFTLDTADYTFTGENVADSSGYSVAGDGDFDGDGLSDLLIGAYLHDSIDSDEGKTYLFISPSIFHDE
ncbi:MAG: hypothetical protein CL930_14970 [Deltaproteobacteria bacterium]|nr:hypothetical protein [Deltaproteobacteria bacterium]